MRRIVVCFATVAAFLFLAANIYAVPQQRQETQATQQNDQMELVTGLNGAPYEAYEPKVIREVQQALKDRGLYQGEVNGVLNEATKEAIGKFQQENGILVTGVPSPYTREALLGHE